MSGFLKKKVFRSGFWLLLCVMAGQFLTSGWVLSEISRRLEIKNPGIFWPLVVVPSFYSPNARFEWKNKVTLLSGKLKIDYNLLPLFLHRSIRIRISGKNLGARLQGKWAEMQGVENIQVDRFEADIEIAPQGLGQIYFVEALSSAFQFRIRMSENEERDLQNKRGRV